jgi:hypothetical protein
LIDEGGPAVGFLDTTSPQDGGGSTMIILALAAHAPPVRR